MWQEFIVAFGMIFFAEMGDKSQMLAMAFASKYRIKYVIIGMFIGVLANHILAIFLSQLVGEIVPLDMIRIFAGAIFLIFGFWSLSVDNQGEEETKHFRYGPMISVSFAFFLGELGDKTQLSAFTLGSESTYPLLILSGTVLGMMTIGMVGIFVGMKLGSNIPEEWLKMISAIVFVVFGSFKLIGSLPGIFSSFYILSGFVLLVVFLFYYRARPMYLALHDNNTSQFKRSAAKLKHFYGALFERLDGICLGENICGGCSEKACLVGYTKQMLRNAKDVKMVDLEYVTKSDKKRPFKQEKLLESLLLILRKLDHDLDKDNHEVLTQLRYNYERLLIDHHIHTYTSKEQYIKKVGYYDKAIAKELRLNWS